MVAVARGCSLETDDHPFHNTILRRGHHVDASQACRPSPARTTGGAAAEPPTSRIEIAAYCYAAQETENIAEAKSLACREAWRLAVVNSPHPFACIEGDVPTARHEYGGQTRLIRTGAPTSRSDKPGGLLSLLKCTAEQWTDAQRRRAILTRACATCMLYPLIHRLS